MSHLRKRDKLLEKLLEKPKKRVSGMITAGISAEDIEAKAGRRCSVKTRGR